MDILLVEDEAGIALVLEYALNDAGHQILGPISTSTAAYSLAMNKRPDFALIDIQLADGNTGTTLAQRLFDDFAIPSIYLTGNGDEAQTGREGSLGYIEKPYHLKTVLQALDAMEMIIAGQIPFFLPMNLKLFVPSFYTIASP